MKKPEPIVTAQECSLCGLAWGDHGEKPTAQTCIDLLRAELARRPRWSYTPAYPYVVGDFPNTPAPWTFTSGTTSTAGAATTFNGPLHVVRDDEEPPEAVSA